MAAANAPITMKEALTLSSVGINPQFITFTHVTMESDKYICIRETAPQNSVVIVDMSMPMQPLRRPITADSALMNPNSRILALKAQLTGATQDHLQIFNIEMKAKVKSYQMPEQIVFWKWITPKMLGLVTQTTVYHWSIEGDLEPVKMFERTANLLNNQIINYRCDPTEKWLALIGIAPGSPERPQLVKGNMQLFSLDQQQSQAFEAHAASFASFKVAGNENTSILICFASKTTNAGQITSKLYVIELGAQPGKPAFTKKQADLFFPPDFADDFPVAVQISHKYSFVYVITKLGFLFVYDLETATAVYRNRISPDPIFLTTEASSVGGFYAVNQRGQVLLATVNEATIVPFVSGQLNNLELAVNLAKRGNLPGAENLEMIDETMTSVEEEPRAVEPKIALAKLARVPKVLQDDKSIKECFEPKFVSIGPYHHGNPKLQEAEVLKKKLARQFVLACSCSSEILYGKLYKEIKQIRNFYENELTVKYNDEALTRILFVDGCFLLYFIDRLLRRRALEDFNLEIGSVLWDSILLENQLPFLVLKLLGENNFEYLPGLIVGYIEFICNNFLPIKEGWKMYNLQPGNSSHLVQLLQIELQGLYEIKKDVKYLLSPPPNYSITELKKVGIRCKPSRRGSFKCTRFGPYQFHGVLELPSMVVGPFTRRNLLNLIAYEMHLDVQRLEIQSYIIFLASLVRQPQDVKALRQARVLYNYIGSDEEVVELFKEISAKFSPEKMLGYDGIQMQIGRYIDEKGRIKIATWLAEVFSDYYSSPWTAVSVLVVFFSVSAAVIQMVLNCVSFFYLQFFLPRGSPVVPD